MKLIVGLGNPGKKYEGSRHNVGWEVLNLLARRHGAGKPRTKFQGEIVEIQIGSEKVALLWPQTFMNNSGSSVQQARDFFKLNHTELIVVCDDFNLPLGQLRFRAKGSAGGQKGLQDVIRRLGGEDFPRLRIGIGTPPPNWDVADYVLSRFSEEERKEIHAAVTAASDALVLWIEKGLDVCMNRYN
jgi:PTH1 family peptidyl-tRNA hydrolase